MRYWDASALVPLLVHQASSERMRALAAADDAVVTWWGTPIECISALARLERDGVLPASVVAESLGRLRRTEAAWAEVSPSSDVREQAKRLLRVHALRAADATQLAAAIVASDFQPGALEFVTLDARQSQAAEREGFAIVSTA